MKLSSTAYEKRIRKVLEDQHFIVGKREERLIREKASNGRRYFFMVAKRIEGRKTIERFIKIPRNNSKTLLLPFQRQIEFAEYAKKHHSINTRGVIAANYNPKKGIPFVVMETFPINHSKIGFIEKNEGVELLTNREARQVIDQLEKFHATPIKSLPPKLRKILKKYPGDYKSFRREVFKFLNKKVLPLDARHRKEPFYTVLERHLNVSGLRSKTKDLLDQMQPIIDTKQNQGPSLAHGDMAPNNLYVFDSGDVELLDLEWIGLFNNRAIAMIRDFGNFRARSWNNAAFRKALDVALIKKYKAKGQKELGEAIVRLSILRSHMQLSGAFENYTYEKQKNPTQARRRKSTEADILQAFKVKL